MLPYVLYHPKSRTTGRTVAVALGISHGKLCSGAKCEKFSHIIRWGNAGEIPATYRDGERWRARIEINPRQAVALASSKYQSLRALDYHGIPVPEFTRDARRVIEWNEDEFIVFGRKFHHTRGQDIEIYYPLPPAEHIENIPTSDFYTKYISPHREYRVHAFRGETIFVQKKVWDQEDFDDIVSEMDNEDQKCALEEEANLIRNHGHGWKFVHFNDLKNVPANVIRWGVSAIQKLGLDFGAADVISTDEKDERGLRKAYVLEVNSAPALEGPSLEVYIAKFSTLLGRIRGTAN